MIRMIIALTIAMTGFCIAGLIAPLQAEVAVQSESAPPKTNFSASPITPGFWQFSNKKYANSNDVAQGCRDYVTFQFPDGYYFTLSMKKRPHEASGPRLTSAIVHEVGRCMFDQKSQTEHCDVSVTEDSGVAQGCRDYVTFQFPDGYYFTLSMKKRPHEASGPRLTSAIVHEVGRCMFDQKSQTEHCDVSVTEDSGATNNGFIEISYSSENGSLKMIIRATITAGSNGGKTETFERFPVKCPDEIVHNLMIPPKQ